MSRREFDRFMVDVGIGRNRKLRRNLTPAERWCYVSGVLALAALSPIRGTLLVEGGEPADLDDIAEQASVPVSVARSTMSKLRDAEMVFPDAELECERVHDFEELNPPPKTDKTAAERMKRYRARLKRRNGERVTDSVTRNARNDDDAVTPPEEKRREEEEKGTPQTPEGGSLDQAREIRDLFAYWQQRCGHEQAQLSPERRNKLKARLKDSTPDEIRRAIDGAAVGAFVNDAGKKFDDLELICRNRTKLEDFIGRATATTAQRPHVKKFENERTDFSHYDDLVNR